MPRVRLRDLPCPAARDKFVDLDDSAHRSHGTLCPTRDLTLVDLSTDGLHRLRVPKAELIDSTPIDYPATAAWAQALHRQSPEIDGLVWMSRQQGRGRAVVLFGDWVRTSDPVGQHHTRVCHCDTTMSCGRPCWHWLCGRDRSRLNGQSASRIALRCSLMNERCVTP